MMRVSFGGSSCGAGGRNDGQVAALPDGRSGQTAAGAGSTGDWFF
jgi:hypothetical protein